MNEVVIPKDRVLNRTAQVVVNCSKENASEYISSSTELSQWLVKSGPVPGAKSVEVLVGPYNFVGAKRKVTFIGGDTLQEQLIRYDMPANYAYKVSDFSNILEKWSGEAYGQLWFDNEDGKTRITWEYSFKYKSLLKRIALSLFLSFVYKKFMTSALEKAKMELEG